MGSVKRFATSLGFTTMTVDFVSTKSWLVKFYEKMGFQVVEEKTTQSLSVPPLPPVLPLLFCATFDLGRSACTL